MGKQLAQSQVKCWIKCASVTLIHVTAHIARGRRGGIVMATATQVAERDIDIALLLNPHKQVVRRALKLRCVSQCHAI